MQRKLHHANGIFSSQRANTLDWVIMWALISSFWSWCSDFESMCLHLLWLQNSFLFVCILPYVFKKLWWNIHLLAKKKKWSCKIIWFLIALYEQFKNPWKCQYMGYYNYLLLVFMYIITSEARQGLILSPPSWCWESQARITLSHLSSLAVPQNRVVPFKKQFLCS